MLNKNEAAVYEDDEAAVYDERARRSSRIFVWVEQKEATKSVGFRRAFGE